MTSLHLVAETGPKVASDDLYYNIIPSLFELHKLHGRPARDRCSKDLSISCSVIYASD